MTLAGRRALRIAVAALVAVAYLAVEFGWFGATKAGPSGDARGPSPTYDPASAEPKDAIPGGGLAAHEGVEGGHILDRHVGRSAAQLRRRLDEEDKREVSTFLDALSAERSVAQVLYDRRADVARWLASNPSGSQAFHSRLQSPAGIVLRRGQSDAVPGRSVQVVLAPSRRFREGFHILTAYISLP